MVDTLKSYEARTGTGKGKGEKPRENERREGRGGEVGQEREEGDSIGTGAPRSLPPLARVATVLIDCL